jgi:hypothetical protein
MATLNHTQADADAALPPPILARYASLMVLITTALTGVAAREGWVAHRSAAADSGEPMGVLVLFALGAVALALVLTLRRLARP